MSIQVRYDPNNGTLPGGLTHMPIINVAFAHTTGDCRRCGRPERGHIWQVVDTDPDDELRIWQDGIIECGEAR